MMRKRSEESRRRRWRTGRGAAVLLHHAALAGVKKVYLPARHADCSSLCIREYMSWFMRNGVETLRGHLTTEKHSLCISENTSTAAGLEFLRW